MENEDNNQRGMRHDYEQMDLQSKHMKEKAAMWDKHFIETKDYTKDGAREQSPEMRARFQKQNEALAQRQAAEVKALDKKQSLEKGTEHSVELTPEEKKMVELLHSKKEHENDFEK